MKLVPSGPPQGHRRARRYAAEMLELHRQGYTYEAIREALLKAGIQVSNSTVQREVTRQARASAAGTAHGRYAS